MGWLYFFLCYELAGEKGFSEPGKLLNTITIPFTAEQEESQSTQLDESVAAFRAGISRVAAKIN